MIPSHIKSKRQLKIWEKQQKENALKRLKHNENQSIFRFYEKIYKSRIVAPEHADQIIDLSCLPENENIIPVDLSQDLAKLSNQFNSTTKAYLIKSVPGLIVIPNPFSPETQKKLVKSCLSDYTKPPNLSNLDQQYIIPSDGIWSLYAKEKLGDLKSTDPEYYIPIRQQSEPASADMYGNSTTTTTTTTTTATTTTTTATTTELSPSQLLVKQRWVTLGYQYHWGTKEYDFENPIPIPTDLSDMMKSIAVSIDNVGCDTWKNEFKGAGYKPEAGIVNFYQLDSTLMSHVDQSEINMDAPLISLSFGHSCIYLVGGETKDVKPTPLKLNSGDIIIMTAIARKAYHGVPRILDGSLPDYLSPNDDPEWSIYGEYMNTTRINLNIRQVLNYNN